MLSLRGAVRARDIRAGAGGGGGGAAFDPESIAGLELWLDATDAATITGTASLVTGWDDKSTAGNDVTAAGAARPSQSTINGLNAITFDGAAEAMSLASASVTGLDGPDITIFAAVNKQFDEADSWPGAFARGSGAWGAGWRLASSDAGGSNMYFSAAQYTSDAALISAAPSGADAFALWAADHEDAGGVKHGYLNNVLAGTDTSGLISGASSHDLTIGQPGTNTTYSLFGSIGEILVYNSVLSEEDRLTVSEYLADKWGFVLPVSDPSFASVTLLLDFAGADEGTDTTDLSLLGHTETFIASTVLDTDLTYLGKNTLIPVGSTGRLEFPSHAAWEHLASTSFTWECGVRFISTAGTQTLLSNFDGTVGAWIRCSGGDIIFVNTGISEKTETWVPSVDTWYHVAVCRDGTSLRIFIDGVELGTATTFSGKIWQGTTGFNVGAARVSTESVNGNIGAVRITKGVARYTANFTPPTEFYPIV